MLHFDYLATDELQLIREEKLCERLDLVHGVTAANRDAAWVRKTDLDTELALIERELADRRRNRIRIH